MLDVFFLMSCYNSNCPQEHKPSPLATTTWRLEAQIKFSKVCGNPWVDEVVDPLCHTGYMSPTASCPPLVASQPTVLS